MMDVHDEDLVELIAVALQRSGPEGNAERVSWEFATIRANTIVRALRRASIITMREQGRRRGDPGGATSGAAKPVPTTAPETHGGCQILPMKRRAHPAAR